MVQRTGRPSKIAPFRHFNVDINPCHWSWQPFTASDSPVQGLRELHGALDCVGCGEESGTGGRARLRQLGGKVVLAARLKPCGLAMVASLRSH